MKPEIIVAVCALIVSLVSLGLSFYFGWCTRDHNRRSVKPLPFVLQSDFEDRIRVGILNNGSGPLILSRAIAKNAKEDLSGHLIDLAPSPPEGLLFTNFNKIQKGRALRPGDRVDLLDLHVNLEDQLAVAYREQLRNVLGNLTLEVDYTDIYDSKFPIYMVEMTWFHRNH